LAAKTLTIRVDFIAGRLDFAAINPGNPPAKPVR